jgi:hypothetical protein
VVGFKKSAPFVGQAHSIGLKRVVDFLLVAMRFL